MQFSFDCVSALGCDQNGFAILEGSYQNRIMPGFTLFVNEILDRMGAASSSAQGLSTTITTAQKFFSSNHRIVIKATGDKVLGILKVGYKKLFLRDKFFNYHEVTPLCVLDFYVHESTQRQGIGKKLFDYMLKFEKKTPQELAYDRPSPKLIGFLKKHFGLVNYVKQNNNFVVFDEFFAEPNEEKVYDPSTNRLARATPMSNAAQSVINNNGYNNTFSGCDRVVNKNVYRNPITGFQTYYLNGTDTVSYDNIYSKRKIDLINDYMSTRKIAPDEFVKEQLGVKETSINSSNDRLNQLMNKITPFASKNGGEKEAMMYNKRNQYATIFDDKKIVEHNYYNQIGSNLNNKITEKEFITRRSPPRTIGQENLQHYSPFSSLGKVYTNVLPTTSSAYGAYYRNPQELDPRSQSPNRIYY